MYRICMAKAAGGVCGIGTVIATNIKPSHCDRSSQIDFESNALLHEEIETVVENIDKDIIRSSCPYPFISAQVDNLSEEDLDLIKLNVSQKVRNLIASSDQNLYNNAFSKLKLKMEGKKQLQYGPSKINIDETASWDELTNKFKCGICLHILAAPVILSCSHNFCGECLHNHISHSEMSDDIVISLCPECRSEFDTAQIIFERVLDQLIYSDVKNISSMTDSERVHHEKNEWESRRQTYFDNLKSSKLKEKENNPTLSDNEATYLIECVTSILVAVVIGMIIYLRK